MARYERRIGPVEAGQGIGMALQSFAQQLQVAQERQKLQRENTFITDFAAKLMTANDQEAVQSIGRDFFGKLDEYGVQDPSRSLAMYLQKVTATKSKDELAREKANLSAAQTAEKAGALNLENAEKAKRITGYQMFAEGRLAPLLTPERLMNEKEVMGMAGNTRAALLAKNPTADLAEVDAAIADVVSSIRNDRKEDIERVRAQNNLAKQSEILGKFKDFDDPQAFMEELGDDFVNAGGTLKSLIDFIKNPSESKAAAKQLEYTQALIDQAKAATDDKKAMTELRKRLPISIFTTQLQGLNQRRNKLDTFDNPIMTEEEYQAEKAAILSQVKEAGYDVGEVEAAASGEKVITINQQTTKLSPEIEALWPEYEKKGMSREVFEKTMQ